MNTGYHGLCWVTAWRMHWKQPSLIIITLMNSLLVKFHWNRTLGDRYCRRTCVRSRRNCTPHISTAPRKKKYDVMCYEYGPSDKTTERPEHISKHFIKVFETAHPKKTEKIYEILIYSKDLRKKDLEHTKLLWKSLEVTIYWRRWCRASSYCTRAWRNQRGLSRASCTKTRQPPGQHYNTVCDTSPCIQMNSNEVVLRGPEILDTLYVNSAKFSSKRYTASVSNCFDIIKEPPVIRSDTVLMYSAMKVSNNFSLRELRPYFIEESRTSLEHQTILC